ncbi:LAGLIDADG family homing endonuclease [Desulfovermiculus halophilus]|jgi:ribonucleoside-diphosphate reductase alpha chain|uniref:LAGLIDADG family homing endonuclease n=1 Tax=Desulfovermiculus halophilus TaxID=339722 RepID=UPI000685301D|nr:LAGLIDADG family homing endonuclease [Desulfovermiculus halophilus]
MELNPNAQLVLTKRYLRKGADGEPIEGIEDLFERVAGSIAREESKYENSPYNVSELTTRFYDLMTSFRFLPNSPTLMNAGTDLGQLAACFVIPVEDSMDGIFDAIKYAALIHKSGGGTGFSFSRLRPQKSRVGSTGGIASGPISFLKIFNTATEQVKQGGTRRGANMGILRVDHPDILEFIRAKEREGKLNNFNLSVALTEKFMQAVDKDEEYPLIAPHTGEEKGSLRAREVYHLLVQKAWESGDPGIIFLDRINRDNPTPQLGEIEATNPCVPADTFVQTSQGPRQVQDLLGGQVRLQVNGREHVSTEHGFFHTGRKRIAELQTAEGYTLRLTPEHKVLRAASMTRYVLRTEWVQAKQLVPGDKVLINDHREIPAWPGALGQAEGYLIGLLLGDGTLKQDKAVLSAWVQEDAVNGQPRDHVACSGIMQAVLEYAQELPHRSDFQGWQKIAGRNEYRLSLGSLKSIALGLGLQPGHKQITPAVEKTSSAFYAGFLRGLFDADGSVQGDQNKGVSLRLAQSNAATLQAVQRMLLRMGIASCIYRNRREAGQKDMPNGQGGMKSYRIQSQHELIITGDNLARYAERIGFHDAEKAEKLQTALASYKRRLNRERFTCTFTGLEDCGWEDVFDVQVPNGHAFDANGLIAHNCGEQPLLPYEACNLGSINVDAFYSETAEDGVDWNGLKETIHLSVRFLDNVIDASRYPLPQITDMVHTNRKIGLGIMGWADLLYQLHIPYNSRRALSMGEKLMDFLHQESRSASKVLAQERGAFPGYPDSVFAQKNLGPYRNATTTTIAPTGTLSILAGCSSGIEPLFALSFSRHVMDGETLLEVNKHFEQALRQTDWYSQSLMRQVAEKGTIRDMDYLPRDLREVFVTSMDFEPIWHLRMQAAFQKYTDNAVSKTVNLPHSATEEDISSIYWAAYELGCKGVTVYRDGCKAEQVLSTGSGSEKAEAKNGVPVRERPDVIYGFTQKVQTGLGDLYLTVNEVDGKPFEVFATIGRSGRSITAKAEAIGRLVSLALRSGVHVRDVVAQLKGIGGEHPVFQKKGLLLSIPDAVAWILENRYLKEATPTGDAAHSLVKPGCPECGQELMFQEGCFICQACGYTKCG